MTLAIATILLFQLGGEILVRAAGLAFPGPVVGLLGLLALLSWRPSIAETLRPVATGLLSNLSLLFVPAGVGIVGQLRVFGADGAALMAAIVLSTVIAILVAVGTFALVARWTGATDE